MKRLGIIDWGIGGISIYKLIKEQLGDIPVTYFSDTGATPYGKMSRPELVARLNAVIRFLKDRGVTHIVIGCNAASTALPFIDKAGLEIKGVIEPAVEMTTKLDPGRLAVIGGRRTILSGVYRKAFSERRIGIRQRIAQPLSALIESGDVDSTDLKREAARILGPIRNSSHILLACTHYPAIRNVLQPLVSSETKFIDPAAEMVKIVSRWRLDPTGTDEFLTTGDAAGMKVSARNAFSVDLNAVKHLDLR